TFVPEGIATAIVFPVSLIVPATPFSENAVIAFADDSGVGVVVVVGRGVLSPPPQAISVKSNIADNTTNAFFIIISLSHIIILTVPCG
ncbi:MAG: hypothetical protein H6Q49_196, partial [Deltaproteobacteria bacterium]|nr:hypothetical protein [Deltaproteobacteria bacterium]